MPEKDLEFILNRENDFIAFNLSLVLLLIEVDPILNKQGHKWDTVKVCGISHIKIVLKLFTEILIFYMQVFIVEVGVFHLKEAIL